MDTVGVDCPFCRIASGSDPEVREVFRDEHVVAFFPTEPATLGHTLVIPRKHVRTIFEVDDDLVREVASASARLSRAIDRAVNPDGLNVIQSNGEAATQTVFHLHVHLVPRWFGDEVGPIWPPETTYSESSKDHVWDAIRDECLKGRRYD